MEESTKTDDLSIEERNAENAMLDALSNRKHYDIPVPPAEKAGTVTPPATPPSDGGTKGAATSATPAASTPQAPASPDFRTAMQQGLLAKGLQVELPEDLTAENWYEKVAPLLQPKLDPEVYAIQDALNGGKTMEQYMQERSEPERLIKLSDEDLYSAMLKQRYGKSDKNPEGWDDEKVARLTESKKANGSLEIEAEDIRITLREQRAKQQEELAKLAEQRAKGQQQVQRDLSDPKVQQEFDQAVEAASKEVVKDGKLFGIDLGKVDDLSGLTQRAKKLLTPDPKTGLSPTDARLQGNNAWVKMALLMELAETGTLASLLKGQSEEFQRSILGQLDLVPGTTSGTARPKDGSLDLDRLSRPSMTTFGKS
jgi:hypothetical protein